MRPPCDRVQEQKRAKMNADTSPTEQKMLNVWKTWVESISLGGIP